MPLLEAWAMTETGAAACIMANREPRQVGERCFGSAAGPRLPDRRRDRHDVAELGGGASRARRRRPEPGFLPRLPEGREGDRGGVGRRLVPYRRRRAERRRGRLPLRRPAQERDPAQRREHLGGRGRERAQTCTPRWPRAPSRRRRPGARRRGLPFRGPAPGVRLYAGARIRQQNHASSGSPTSRRRAASPSSTRLPLTVSQKIQRGELKALAAEALQAARCSIAARRSGFPRSDPRADARELIPMARARPGDERAGLRALRRSGGGAGDRAVRALLDPQRPLVHRPGAGALLERSGLAKPTSTA